MKDLSAQDQNVLRLLSDGVADHEICRDLGIGRVALKRSLARIEARAGVESDDAGRFYERALRIRAVNQNAALHAQLKALMEILPQAVLVINGRTGEIGAVNVRACALFGYSVKDFCGMKVEQLMPESLVSIHVVYRLSFLKSVRRREMGYHPPIVGVRRDGSNVRMAIALTATAAVDDVMVVCTELTEEADADEHSFGTSLATQF